MGSSTSPLSLRIILISTVVLSSATATKFFFPSLLTFAVYDIPVLWSIILSWLKPPYLYIVINGIIITIVASSRFQHHYNNYHNNNNLSPSLASTDNHLPLETPPTIVQATFDVLEHPTVVYETDVKEIDEESRVVYEVEPPVIDIETVPVPVIDSDVVATTQGDDKFMMLSRSTWNNPSPVKEMPLVSSRFANQRKMVKSNPEGMRSLRVSKPRKHETLESTWKTITDGRHMPLNRHLRKSDTFENNHHAPPSDVSSKEQGTTSVMTDYVLMNKSETFNDHTEQRVVKNSLKLRKEGSLSHDELNRKVEAFIKKFNDEMRLQRQESLKRYMDMINRGA